MFLEVTCMSILNYTSCVCYLLNAWTWPFPMLLVWVSSVYVKLPCISCRYWLATGTRSHAQNWLVAKAHKTYICNSIHNFADCFVFILPWALNNTLIIFFFWLFPKGQSHPSRYSLACGRSLFSSLITLPPLYIIYSIYRYHRLRACIWQFRLCRPGFEATCHEAKLMYHGAISKNNMIRQQWASEHSLVMCVNY